MKLKKIPNSHKKTKSQLSKQNIWVRMSNGLPAHSNRRPTAVVEPEKIIKMKPKSARSNPHPISKQSPMKKTRKQLVVPQRKVHTP